MQVDKVWLLCKGKKFVAIDSQSGGYPYLTDFWNAKKFQSLEEAGMYNEHFLEWGWELYSCNQVTLTFTLMPSGYDLELEKLKEKYGR